MTIVSGMFIMMYTSTIRSLTGTVQRTRKVIVQGAEYIVYYLDGMEEIMSAELISGVD